MSPLMGKYILTYKSRENYPVPFLEINHSSLSLLPPSQYKEP